jgi:cytosine/uracil/thiamine/allantoin permease
VSRSYLPRNFWQSLIAVVAGNAIYFLFMNDLPRRARHETYRLDLGLVVDFWICLVIYGLLELYKRWRRPRRDASK